jgi:hypothetical protein
MVQSCRTRRSATSAPMGNNVDPWKSESCLAVVFQPDFLFKRFIAVLHLNPNFCIEPRQPDRIR